MLMTICILIVSFSLKHNLFLEKQQTKDMWTCSGEKGNDRFGFSFVVTYQLLLKSEVKWHSYYLYCWFDIYLHCFSARFTIFNFSCSFEHFNFLLIAEGVFWKEERNPFLASYWVWWSMNFLKILSWDNLSRELP